MQITGESGYPKRSDRHRRHKRRTDRDVCRALPALLAQIERQPDRAH